MRRKMDRIAACKTLLRKGKRPKSVEKNRQPRVKTDKERQKSKSKCEVCLKLQRFWDLDHSAANESLGTPRKVVLTSKCEVHKRLLEGCFPQFWNDWSRVKSISIRLNPERLASIYLENKDGYNGSYEGHCNLELVQGAGKRQKVGTGRILDAKWIDSRVFVQWMKRCRVEHGENCGEIHLPNRFSSVRPSWLVDLWKLCLVSGSEVGSYVALSYVWGGVPTFKTGLDNIERLQVPSALSTAEIPRTIRHAFALTEMLGERYLWVDALCIIQDDEKSKPLEIANMTAIYANAAITIIASQGINADSGLPGIRNVSQARNFDQKLFHITPQVRLVKYRRRFNYSIWNTRGWTYQEGLFSRRKIIFVNDSVRWECFHSTWHEESDLPSVKRSINNKQSSFQRLFLANIPDLRDFFVLVKDYNSRYLTYPSDALSAFAGISSAVSSVFKSGFIHGMPVIFFHVSLMWQPWSPLPRRSWVDRTGRLQYFPSWSWIGWQGELITNLWSYAMDYYKRETRAGRVVPPNSPVIPLFQWYKHRNPTEEGILIHTNWNESREEYMHGNTPPPAGWIRCPEPLSETGHISAEASLFPKWCYKHVSDESKEFWYPIPFPDDSENQDITAEPFISCRTRRAWLVAGERRLPDVSLSIALNDNAGRQIGYLRLHDQLPKEDAMEWPNHQVFQQYLELVEIATGWRWASYVDVDDDLSTTGESLFLKDEPLKFGLKYEYYNVLCIEWVDGIAYRKGLGSVSKEGWEAQEREWIDLMLG